MPLSLENVFLGMYVCRCKCERSEKDVKCLLGSCSTILFLRQGLSINWELADLAELSGQ